MASDPKKGNRFASAFADELGKWAARLLIAGIVAVFSGYVTFPT
ncbi:hypothetical protein [Sphingobium sp. IP1]|nr:hypothetical protein [Sphingobium sp. IP1]